MAAKQKKIAGIMGDNAMMKIWERRSGDGRSLKSESATFIRSQETSLARH
jgi:hypothetical protein